MSTIMLLNLRLDSQPNFSLTHCFYSPSCQDQLIAICRALIDVMLCDKRLWIVRIANTLKPPIEITSMGIFFSIAPSLNVFKLISWSFFGRICHSFVHCCFLFALKCSLFLSTQTCP
jgi:hypothetical protein